MARPEARIFLRPGMVALYTLTIFVGALLLFSVQPLFARLMLPLLGGSPAVWNTAMVFFQGALLAGYAYAHGSTRKLGVRRQAGWHLPLLLAPLGVLPLALPAGWTPPAEGSPIPWLLALMAISVGPPFFVLSSTSPLLQKWFASTDHPQAKAPYFLYAASNVGSLLALLAYPLWFERHLTLVEQGRLWTAGYAVFVTLAVACAVVLWKNRAGPPDSAPAGAPARSSAGPAPNWALRRRWVLLSFVPSSLLLGVTGYVSTEVAVVPLLWVLPLSLYLLTFVLAFAQRRWVSGPVLGRALPMGLVPLAMILAAQGTQPLVPIAAIHLIVFFLMAWLCHAQLADTRPDADYLTEFYLWLSVGGVLGGAFNALAAPLLFDGLWEYPIMLVLGSLIALPRPADARGANRGDWLWPAGLAVLAAVLLLPRGDSPPDAAAVPRLALGTLAGVCFFFSKRRLRFALGLVVLLLGGAIAHRQTTRELAVKRSFFGVHHVFDQQPEGFHRLLHGSTPHGLQDPRQERRREPLTYYHRTGPVGQLMADYANDPARRIAVVGLGAGSMAAYALPGQAWTFYEIDPAVLGIARDPRLFTFLSDSPGRINCVLGDARLSLARAPDVYDVLVLDAYSSDAIPVHLVTREALALYRSKLAPGGLLAFHISNLHLDLEPVFANLAADAGLFCLVRDDTVVSQADKAGGKSASVWLVMAAAKETLRPLAHDPRWLPGRRDPALALWTDDYSSLLSVIRWR